MRCLQDAAVGEAEENTAVVDAEAEEKVVAADVVRPHAHRKPHDYSHRRTAD